MEVGWCDVLDPFLRGGSPASPCLKDEGDEAAVVMVPGSFLRFALLCGGGVGAGAAGGARGAIAHSVGYADVNELLPIVDGGNDVHNGLTRSSLFVGVVQFWYVLLSVSEVSHVSKPVVQGVSYVVVFGVRLAADGAGECVVSVAVELV